MPDTIAPPPVPRTAVAPTPAQEYKLSAHPPSSRGNDPALTAALSKRAGTRPGIEQPPPTAQPKVIPSQPPRPPEPPAAPPAAAPAAIKGDEKPAPHVKFIVADDQPPTAPAAPAAAPTPESAEPPPEVFRSASAQVRDAYERVKANRDAVLAERDLTRKEAAEYRAKLKGYEDRIKVLESAEGRAKEAETRALALDERLRVTDYLQHPEFHEKFVKPVADAVANAQSMVCEFMVNAADGTQRMGNAQDFNAVLGQPNYTLMLDKAVEIFGDRVGPTIFEKAQAVKTAQMRQQTAVKEAGLRSVEWQKSRSEQEAAARAEGRAALDAQIAALSDRYPQLYRPAEGDKEAAEARASGEALARPVIYGADEPISREAFVERVAKVFHRASAFPMVELARTRLQAENEALKARLAKYESSTPDAGSAQRPGGVQQDSGGVVVGGETDYSRMMHESLTKRAGRRG